MSLSLARILGGSLSKGTYTLAASVLVLCRRTSVGGFLYLVQLYVIVYSRSSHWLPYDDCQQLKLVRLFCLTQLFLPSILAKVRMMCLKTMNPDSRTTTSTTTFASVAYPLGDQTSARARHRRYGQYQFHSRNDLDEEDAKELGTSRTADSCR